MPEWLFWAFLMLFAWANTYANFKWHKTLKLTSERITNIHKRLLKLEYPHVDLDLHGSGSTGSSGNRVGSDDFILAEEEIPEPHGETGSTGGEDAGPPVHGV